jgi:hypothetical protein
MSVPGVTTPLPGEIVTEHSGRTFALTELLVRAAWRRQGIGRWGWTKLARTQSGLDVLVLELPGVG